MTQVLEQIAAKSNDKILRYGQKGSFWAIFGPFDPVRGQWVDPVRGQWGRKSKFRKCQFLRLIGL